MVFGIASKKIQTRFLERKELTYEEALQVATTMELSERGATSLQNGTSASTSSFIVNYIHASKRAISKAKSSDDYVSNSSGSTSKRFVQDKNNNRVREGRNNKSVKCFRCGEVHLANMCILNRNVRCSNCKIIGHVSRVFFFFLY